MLEGGKKESFSETFCSRNFNSFGRYVSIISIQWRRAILIISEATFNVGWNLIVDKFDSFINESRRPR